MKRIMITGSEGNLGSQIAARLQDQPKLTLHTTDHTELDVTSFHDVNTHIQHVKPDLIIHCAAWTDVDACAQNPEQAFIVNGYGAGNVASAAAKIGAAVAYISTNEVFSGNQPHRLYHEYDAPAPINPYGMSKHIGEQEVTRLNPKHYIIRTSWLFAHSGKNFLQSIIKAAATGKSLRVVTDEIANPTYTNDLADAIIQLTATGRCGTYHLVNEGTVSRWGFARYILDHTGYRQTPITRISRTDWTRPSTPPPYCGLQNIAAAHLGVRLRPWQAAVDAFLIQEGLRRDDT